MYGFWICRHFTPIGKFWCIPMITTIPKIRGYFDDYTIIFRVINFLFICSGRIFQLLVLTHNGVCATAALDWLWCVRTSIFHMCVYRVIHSTVIFVVFAIPFIHMNLYITENKSRRWISSLLLFVCPFILTIMSHTRSVCFVLFCLNFFRFHLSLVQLEVHRLPSALRKRKPYY